MQTHATDSSPANHSEPGLNNHYTHAISRAQLLPFVCAGVLSVWYLRHDLPIDGHCGVEPRAMGDVGSMPCNVLVVWKIGRRHGVSLLHKHGTLADKLRCPTAACGTTSNASMRTEATQSLYVTRASS